MPKKKFFLLSLGCAKNTVDSESMASLLEGTGYQITDNPSKADVLIVNTCGFIEISRQESYRVLDELAKSKRPGQYLIAAGCLTQRYREEVARTIPGIDGLLGTRRWMDILDIIQQLHFPKPSTHNSSPLSHFPDLPTVGTDEHGVLRAAVQGTSAYLKIADGCRRPCAFCAIPLIKGTAVSRPMETILKEAQILQQKGIQELVLIAQDTTDYGSDLGMDDGLASLLKNLIDVSPDIPWIRIMYAYPGSISDSLIDIMAAHPQVVPYLDIPLQHAHPDVLRRMHRPANMDWVYRTIQKMRDAIPNLAIRTTMITGYPDETENEFQTLLDFISAIRFDRIGAFAYSFEPGTPAEPLGDPIPAEVKQDRLEKLMLLQEKISLEINQNYIGKKMDVLIEGKSTPNRQNPQVISVGRSTRDAPEVDGLVILEGEAPIGKIIPVKITGALVHDLTGIIP
jgi:ribosomal protein S12 methylthiotransferase